MNTGMERRLAGFVFCALLLAVGGCATVSITSRDGTITTRGLFGTTLRSLPLAPVTITTRGFGLFATRRSIAAGWHSETGVYIPNGSRDCRIVLIANEEHEIDQLISALKRGGTDPAEICVDQQGELK